MKDEVPRGWFIFAQIYVHEKPYGPYLLKESDEINIRFVINNFLDDESLNIKSKKDYQIVGGGYFRYIEKFKKELQPEGSRDIDYKINEEHLEKMCKKEGTVFKKKGKYYYITLPESSNNP